jgi:hypothetical protein
MQRLSPSTLILGFLVCVELAAAQEVISKDFPAGPARDRMVQLATDFPKDTNIKLEGIAFDGSVRDIADTAKEMLNTTVILGNDESTSKFALFDFDQIAKQVPGQMIDRFLESLQLNLSRGDFRIWILLRDSQNNKQVKSLNSMKPDGSMFSGGFFATARLPGRFRTQVSLENTVCYREVLTTYLWGAPAETVEGCVRASCQGAACTDCVVTSSHAFGGFFAKAEIVPNSGARGRVVAHESKKCCDGYFNWAWATGFKSIKVSAEKLSVEIEGHIGQSGNGSFTVTECCPRGTVALGPSSERSTVGGAVGASN